MYPYSHIGVGIWEFSYFKPGFQILISPHIAEMEEFTVYASHTIGFLNF